MDAFPSRLYLLSRFSFSLAMRNKHELNRMYYFPARASLQSSRDIFSSAFPPGQVCPGTWESHRAKPQSCVRLSIRHCPESLKSLHIFRPALMENPKMASQIVSDFHLSEGHSEIVFMTGQEQLESFKSGSLGFCTDLSSNQKHVLFLLLSLSICSGLKAQNNFVIKIQ